MTDVEVALNLLASKTCSSCGNRTTLISTGQVPNKDMCFDKTRSVDISKNYTCEKWSNRSNYINLTIMKNRKGQQ